MADWSPVSAGSLPGFTLPALTLSARCKTLTTPLGVTESKRCRGAAGAGRMRAGRGRAGQRAGLGLVSCPRRLFIA